MNCEFRKVANLKPGQNARSKEEFKKDQLKDLVESIKHFGVVIPLIIKPNGEIIAGHRRHAAAVLAGVEDVPVIVYEGGEISAEEIAMLENQHRQGLRLMDEIQAVLNCLENHETTETIMSRLGMTKHQVTLRRNVAKNLSQEWKTRLETDSGVTSAEHLDLIARLPEDVQNNLLAEVFEPIADGNLAVGQLKGFIESNVMFDLKAAPWLKDEAIMYADMPMKVTCCNECSKRTDACCQTELFPVPVKKKIVRCLDPKCFKDKMHDWVMFYARKKKEHYPALVVSCGDDTSYSSEREQLLTAIVTALKVERVFYGDYKPAAQNTKGAIPMLSLNSYLHLDFGWFVLRQAKKDKTQPVETKAGRPALVTMEQKKQALHGARLKIVYDALCKALEGHPGLGDHETLLGLLASFGGFCGRTILDPIKYPNRFKQFVVEHHFVPFNHPWDEKMDKMDADPMLAAWMQIRGSLIRKISGFTTASQCVDAEGFCTVIGEIIGFDWSAAYKAAVDDKPEPKSWKKD